MLNYRISEGKESLIDALLNIQPGKDILIGYGDIPESAEKITLPSGMSGTVIERRGNLIAVGIFAGAAVAVVLYVQKDSQMIRIRPIPHQKMMSRTGEIVTTPEYNRWVERIKTEAPEYLPEWEKTDIGIEKEIESIRDILKKEPWQMTKDEFAKIVSPEQYIPFPTTISKLATIYVNETGEKLNTEKEVTEKLSKRYPANWKLIKLLEKGKEKIYDSLPEKVKKGMFGINMLEPYHHEYFVGQAIIEGKPVPSEVLKEYPNLKATPKQPWEMTYREFADLFEDVWGGMKFNFAERVGKPLGIQSQAGEPYHMIKGKRIGYSGSLARDRWRLAIVDKALSEGKKVPEDVLAELSKSLKEEREKLGGTEMAEQYEEKPPTQDVKNWMRKALGIEDYKGGRHDRIQMLALLIQNSELGNIRSISDAGSMAIALGKDLEYGTPPPYGKSMERYYAEKIAAETGKEVPIIKSSDIIKPPSSEPLKSAEELYAIYTSGYSGISFQGVARQDTTELADSILFDLRHLNLNPKTYTRDILISYAAKFKEWAQRDYEKEHAKIVERQQKEAAEKEKERIEGGQAFWDEVKNLKVIDYEVEHDVNPDRPTRTYFHVYDRTFAILENGKKVQVSYVINKGEYGKRALKATKGYYAQFYNQYMGKPLSEWITYEDLIRGNRYEDYKAQQPKPRFTFIPESPPVSEQPKKLYRYYYRNRPPGIGTQPEGFISSEPWLPAKLTPHGRTAFGWVEYDRPLTNEEISGFELFEDEVELPKLVKELVQFAKDEGIEEVMKAIDAEYGRAIWEFMKAQKRIMPGVGQKEQIKAEIMRLAGITEASQKAPQKASLEDMVREYKEIGEEMRRLGITTRAGPQADVLMTRENQLWEAIRDIYIQKIDQIPESKQLMPEGLGVLALAGRAATEAVQESPSKVNLEEMLSGWLKGQQMSASIQAARSVEELQPIMEVINFLPLAEIDKKTLIGRYQKRHSELLEERPFGAPVKTGEEKPRVLGAPTPQQRFEEEQRRKAAEKRGVRAKPTLTGAVSTSRRLEEFGIKEKMLPELTASMQERIRGAQAVKDVIHYFRDGRPPIRGVAYRARDGSYFVEANDGNIYDSMNWEDVEVQPPVVREPARYAGTARGY